MQCERAGLTHMQALSVSFADLSFAALSPSQQKPELHRAADLVAGGAGGTAPATLLAGLRAVVA